MHREWTTLITPQGRIPLTTAGEIAELVRGFTGKRLVIIIKPWVKRRSTSQNNYYFGVVVKTITAMFREAGNYMDEEDCHEYLKEHIGKLKQVIVLPDGEVKTILGSTKKLTTMEFEDYLTKCRAFAAEYDVIIPLPNEPVDKAIIAAVGMITKEKNNG